MTIAADSPPDRPTTSPDAPSTDPPTLGVIGWIVIAVGWLIMARAVAGALGDDRLGGAGSWITWILGAAIVHDAIVLPIVLGVGWCIARFVPMPWRTPVRVAVVVGAILTLATWPIVRRYGARADNPSILPLDTSRNLVLILVALGAAAALAGLISRLRGHRGSDPGERAGTAGDGEASVSPAGSERDSKALPGRQSDSEPTETPGPADTGATS